MMLNYIYDGTFNGLLTAVYEIYYRRQVPQQITAYGADMQLFIRHEYIETDPVKADKVYEAIETKISTQAMRNAYFAYLSEHPEAGMWIYEYLRLGWKLGPKVDLHLTDERVHRIHLLSQKVRTEWHRLLGLVRFQRFKMDIYYAAIEPDHNIIELLAPHFVRRLSDQNWIIHDVSRDLAIVYNQKEWFSTTFTLDDKLEIEQEEAYYQRLWKQYYNSITITSRINPRLQKRCMPQRYWSHLVEKN